MKLNYTYFKIFNKRYFPFIEGIKEHGNRACFELDNKTKDQLRLTKETCNLCIFEDETISISVLWYDTEAEEYKEETVYTFTDDKKKDIIKEINQMLEDGIMLDNEYVDNLSDLIRFLKH